MILAILATFLLFVAFLLLLLVSLSLPIIKSIYLFNLQAEVNTGLLDIGGSGSVNFGVWGYCVSAIDVSVLGFNTPISAGQCSPTELGYNFDGTLEAVLSVTGLEGAIPPSLTKVLVLHPIACGFTFLALLMSMYVIRRHWLERSFGLSISRKSAWWSLGVGLLATALTTAAFLIDVIYVVDVRGDVSQESDGVLLLTWGNAVWMALGAALALWASLVEPLARLALCPCWRNRRKADVYQQGASSHHILDSDETRAIARSTG